MSMQLAARLAAAVLAMGAGALNAAAQEWPTKPVRLIIPVASGAGTELVARVVGEEFQANLKQPMVIENRPAGAGIQAADLVARSDPDGYTLFLANSGNMTILPHLLKRIPYDPLKDFTAITKVVEIPICLVVHKDVPVNNARELVDYAKANPGKLSFGSSGQGSAHHLAGEYLKSFAGIDMVHVPYRGGAPAMTDLLSGQIPVLFATLSTVIPHMSTGSLKVLGMIEPHRSRAQPQIPAIAESLPGYAVPAGWLGYFGPANMAPDLVRRINAELVRAINAPKVRQAFDKVGFELAISTPSEYVATIRADYDRYKKIIADARIEPQ